MKHTNDIDRFAEQAGFPARRAFSDLSDLYPRLERFAALVLANHPPQSSMAWQEGYEAGAAAEREACAKLVEDWDSDSADPRDIAASIRARGQDPMPLFDDWNKDWTK